MKTSTFWTLQSAGHDDLGHGGQIPQLQQIGRDNEIQ